MREEVRKTCPSLHDPVQSRQRVLATTPCNAESARRNKTISRIRIQIAIPVSGESNYSWYERTFPSKRNIILLPRGRPANGRGRYRETLAATIPVLNYHKPLNPARTKLFLSERGCAITQEYGSRY